MIQEFTKVVYTYVDEEGTLISINRNGVEYNQQLKCWQYSYGTRGAHGYQSEIKAAKAFITAKVNDQPKRKEKLRGKKWSEIFPRFGFGHLVK